MTKKHYPVAEPQLCGREIELVTQCLEANQLTHGIMVEEFERMFAHACGMNHGVACANGTVALHLALLALGVKPGDEVLVPTLTYIATVNAIAYCGATPVLCDVDPDTWNISLDEMISRRTKRTVGVLPVHLYGHPAEMDEINSFARHHGLWVLEDAAEAHGATYRGRPAGSLGTMSVFSFYGNKVITTGEGGMVLTNNRSMLDTLRLLRGQGMSPVHRYFHPVLGYNYRMTNLQGALGVAQTEKLHWHVDRHRNVDIAYRALLRHHAPEIRFQNPMSYTETSGWMTTILVPALVRDQVRERLLHAGIETRPTFLGAHRMPMYTDTRPYPVADGISACGINLPTHAGMTMADVNYIAGQVLKALE